MAEKFSSIESSTHSKEVSRKNSFTESDGASAPPAQFDKPVVHKYEDGIKRIVGFKNKQGDLWVSPSSITKNYTIIIKSEELAISNTTQSSEKNSHSLRKLNYDEIMTLIQQKVEELEKKRKEKIGHHTSIDDNLNILQARLEMVV